jgi:anti-sigma factor (TIGR02949 family)
VTTCDALRRLISPYLDGELVGEDRAEFEAHVRDCPACRSSLEQEQAVVRAIQEALPLYEAPLALRERVDRLVRESAPAPSKRAAWAGPSLGRPLVLAASLVAIGLAATALLREPKASPARAAGAFASLAVDTHLRHERGQLPLEVTSEAPADVSRFFEGRVPFHLTLPAYPVEPGEEKPYRLVGGRLVTFAGDYAAYVAYRMDERPISLLVTSADRVTPEGGEAVVQGGLTFHMESVSGLKVITWTDKGLTYALASDLAVTGSRSCMVCHGSAEERRKFEGL